MKAVHQIYIASESSKDLVIVFKESKKTSTSQVNEYFDYLDSISQNNNFHLIMDLSDTSPPTAEIRAVLRDRFKAMESRIISYHVYVGKNFLLKVAVKFVGASIGLGSFKLHNSIDQAKKYIDENF
ncbi:MAG: hypothetical protein CL853_04400 [Crocinitomicaceae bacterium]|nr:hypothetical protein [Crocinitomicaceae bacterium]|tara:strand:+ start:213 stop:590 length:378 start_codon:yes stop_codon:yes gene_type:complete